MSKILLLEDDLSLMNGLAFALAEKDVPTKTRGEHIVEEAM